MIDLKLIKQATTKPITFLISLVLVVVLLIIAPLPASETSTETVKTDTGNQVLGESQEFTSARVVSITDGDTFKVEIGDQVKTVRLVGINTPETVDPRKPVECFGKTASDRLTELLTNQVVLLESDSTQSSTDRYGRLLRFAFIAGDEMQDVGLTLLKEGYAEESLYSSVPHKYRVQYLAAQAEARAEGRGLWAEDACEILH